MCSRHANHDKLNNEGNWGSLYDHLMSCRIFTLTINQNVRVSSEDHEANGYGRDFDFLIIVPNTNGMFRGLFTSWTMYLSQDLVKFVIGC
jgi:hypothetical protein